MRFGDAAGEAVRTLQVASRPLPALLRAHVGAVRRREHHRAFTGKMRPELRHVLAFAVDPVHRYDDGPWSLGLRFEHEHVPDRSVGHDLRGHIEPVVLRAIVPARGKQRNDDDGQPNPDQQQSSTCPI